MRRAIFAFAAVSILICAVANGAEQKSRAKQPRKEDPAATAARSYLNKLVGSWRVTSSTWERPWGDIESTKPVLAYSPAAGGLAVYSVYRHTTGRPYEANALWTFDPKAQVVRVFEVNSSGVVDSYECRIDADGSLVGEVRDPKTGELLRKTVSKIDGSTLTMEWRIYEKTGEKNYAVTLVRQ